MTNKQLTPITGALISTADLSRFFDCSEAFARTFMKAVDIPKRGGGYSKTRLAAAMGFPTALDLDTREIWAPLLDAPKAAKASGQSAKTFGRMLDGSHRDKTFTNYIYLGPRKRLIFPFELKAWIAGHPPNFIREVNLMHPALRGGRAAPIGKVVQGKPALSKRILPSAACLFLPTKRME